MLVNIVGIDVLSGGEDGFWSVGETGVLVLVATGRALVDVGVGLGVLVEVGVCVAVGVGIMLEASGLKRM